MFKHNFKKLTMVLAILFMINILTTSLVQADPTKDVTGVVTDCNYGKPISGVEITLSKNGNTQDNYDSDTSDVDGKYSVNIHNGAGSICVTKADGYESYSTSLDNFTEYYNINTPIKEVINKKNIVIDIQLRPTTGVSINVTDSSNQVINSYLNTGGKTINSILNPAVKLAADAKAKITYGFNDLTFSKYKFVEASDLTTVPQFPGDTAMTDIPLPEPNTADAYKDDIGKQNYLTTKHYEYAGKAGTASARNVSFGTPLFDGVFEQEAVTNLVNYDLGKTDGSNFYVSKNGGNTTSYGSALDNPTSTTIPYNGKYYPKTKYASAKAMKMWGYFVPEKTGSYILGAWSDDGAYGYIIKDGVQQVFVDDWSIKAPFDRTKGTSMELTAGKYYPIYMEWYEGCPTQAAFVPEYKFNGSSSYVPIPENELYSSKTTTPGDIAGAYFGDVSGISFPAQDGIYYVASKFKSKEGTTKGLYGPFIIDNNKPVISDLVVTSNNDNGNKWAVSGSILTTNFTASEKLSGDPQILINGYATNSTITKNSQNNYTATVNIGSDGSVNSNKDKLIDGLITVQVAHYSDLYGNEGVAVQDSTVTYDNTAPTVALTYSSNPTSVGTQVVTATYSESVKSGETPQISINQQGTTDIKTTIWTLVSTDRKIWTYNYMVKKDDGSAYKDGVATVTLSTVHDGAGNAALSPTGNTFTINTQALTVTLTFSKNPVSIGEEIITATYSKPVKDGQTPNISIKQQGSAVTTQQNMLVGSDRKIWTYNYTVHADNGSTYKDGIATVTLSTVNDELNNTSVAPSVNTFTIDTKSPTVKLTYSANPVKAGTEIITATYSEAVKVGQIPKISIDQQGSVDIASQSMTAVGTDRTTWTYAYTVNTNNGNTYKDGLATVTLSTIPDAAGNNATAATGNTFTIDTIAPTVTIGAPSSTLTKNAPITYTVTYSGADNVSLSSSNVSLVKTESADGQVTSSGTGNTRTVAVDNITGDGTLGIRIAAGTATDNAGNAALAPLDSATFLVRNTAPAAPAIAAPIDGTITNINKPTIKGTGAVEAEVTVYDSGVKIGTTKVDDNKNWSLILTNVLSDGAHVITATQKYTADNVSEVSNTVNLTIDTTVTAPEITSPIDGTKTNNNKPTIEGNGEVGAVVTVYDNEEKIETTTVNDDASWSSTVTNSLSDGNHVITAIQKDIYGNVSEKSNIVNLLVDTSATIIEHGMFISGEFIESQSQSQSEYELAKDFSGSFGVEVDTPVNKKILLENNVDFTIDHLELWIRDENNKAIYIKDIGVSTNTSIPIEVGDYSHYILVYKGTVNKNTARTELINTVKLGGKTSNCYIKVVDIVDLF